MTARRVSPLLLVALDALGAVAAYRLAFLLRQTLPIPGTKELLPRARFVVVEHRWLTLVLLAIVAAYLLELYRDLVGKRFRELATGALGAAGLASLGLVAAYFFASDPVFPRSIVPLYWILFALFLLLDRQLLLRFVRPEVVRVVVVGRTETARLLIDEFSTAIPRTREVVGVLREVDDDDPAAEFCGVEVLGGIDRAGELVRDGRCDEILLAPKADWRDRLLGEISRLEATGTRVTVAPSLYEILLGKLAHVNIRDRPLLEVVRDPDDRIQAAVKRTFDLLLALALIAPGLLVSIVFAPLIRLSSPGPVLFRQRRIGRGGRVFELIKFRTMGVDAEVATGAVLAEEDDPRATRVGRFLRRSRLDEVPQLINVLRGDMSFVGPRPERPEFADRFSREITGYDHRHLVRPGITGLAQVRGGYHTEAAVKLMYDLVYVYNRSVGMDVLIILETIRTVLLGRGSA